MAEADDKFISIALASAVAAARQAGDMALAMQSRLQDIRFKGEKDIVTEADYACDASIRKALRHAFPDHNLVTEEAADVQQGSDCTWYVDPIDGTVNYSRGFPLWGVSIGMRRGDHMAAGAIYLPALNELYTATRGGGAFVNGRALKTSAVDKLGDAIISHGDFNVGSNEAERRRLNVKNLRARLRTAEALQRMKCLGTAVLEGAYVAAGRMDAYCMLSFKPWDVAVTSLLVSEAGGRVTHLDGSAFDVEGVDALFSNGTLHAELLDLLGWTNPTGG